MVAAASTRKLDEKTAARMQKARQMTQKLGNIPVGLGTVMNTLMSIWESLKINTKTIQKYSQTLA